MGRFLSGLRDALIGQEIIQMSAVPQRKSTTFETVNPNPLLTVTSNGEEVTIHLQELMGASPATMYRTQPYLRSVVDFLGRNIAQLGLHCYDRVSDTERIRDTTSAMPLLIQSPNDHTTRYELLNALISDLALWDEAFWLLTPASGTTSGWKVTQIPVVWVNRPYAGTYWEPGYWLIVRPGHVPEVVPAEQMIHFHGWDPEYSHLGVSPVGTLKHILYEQVAAVVYRQQRWEKGGRVGHVITRPATAPAWSIDAEERFRREWRNSYSGNYGPEAGGTPILQDGMTLTKIGFSAVEDEFVEASKLALTTVAAVYHVNPTMLGLLDNANYSNVREFRRMLYGDTLGPWLSMIEDRVNNFVVPKVQGVGSQLYVEFNIAEKLQGSFEEQATVASMAVGGPYMTRNEYRLRQNLPPIDGADDLIVPLNVTVGGQPSPAMPLSQMPLRLSAPDRHGASFRVARMRSVERKLRASQTQEQRTEAVLRRFYKHQRSVVVSKIGAKSKAADDSWWDEDKWNDELTDDLFGVSMTVSTDIGNDATADLGVSTPYNPRRTRNYLREMSRNSAESINAATKSNLDDALDADPDDEDAMTPDDVFDEAENERSATGAVSLCCSIAGFAMSEAGRQAAPNGGAQKTWIVNSSKSRHPEMDGETVPIDDDFSNGAKWPGDSSSLDVDQTAGCQCELEISIP